MDFNGSKHWLEHAIKIATDPNNRSTYQAQIDTTRRKRVPAGVEVRPVFIPLRFEMNLAGQVAPYRQTTQTLPFDVVITGIKADSQTRDIVLKYTESEQTLLRTGNDFNLFLRVDEIAGQTVTNGGGQLGVFNLTAPIFLEERRRFTVEMYKTDTTIDAEVANIVLIGLRVYRKDYVSSVLSVAEANRIDAFIAQRPIPQPRLLKVPVAFDSAVAGGVATNLFTPPFEEPFLLRGIRSTLRQSTIEIGVEGAELWTQGATPIWAVAGEDEMVHENYHWLPGGRPLYIPADRQISIPRIVNGAIDNVNIDAQTGNSITFYGETV